MSGIVVGADVGGTKIAGLAMPVDGASPDHGPLASCTVPLDGEPLEAQVLRLIELVMAELPSNRALAAVGLAVPGQVDAVRGVMRLAVNVDPAELAIGPLVADALGVPCFVEHDARAAATWLATAGFGDDVAYVSVGTGISAGILLGGRVLRGADGLAGEIGHVVADPDGPECACGLRGCLEALASGPAIARAAGAARAEDVFAAATDGDPAAAAIVERAAGHLARAIRGLAFAYGIRRVVVGGGVTRAGAAFAEPLQLAIARERTSSPLLARALPEGSVVISEDPRPIGALGAASVARIGLARQAARPEEVAPP